jgi:predicted RNase H-like nuclease (RuvC/YqgF family)
MSQDINTKEIYDCEGCRENKFLVSANKALQEEIASLQQQLTERENEICLKSGEIKAWEETAESYLKLMREKDWEIASLQQQLTEAQGKRGKVVSIEEIANLIMFGFNSQPWSLVSTFENSGEVVNIATAIFKAVYGGDNEK